MKKNKKIKKILILSVLILFGLTGCTTYLSDENNKRISNEETGQGLPKNILCQPENSDILKIYEKYEKTLEIKVEDLPKCQDLKIYNPESYTGLWTQIFIIPLAWYIIKVGLFLKSYGLAVMAVGILIRIVIMPLTIKTLKQSENMKKANPEIKKLEEKYKNKTESDAMMQKSQEMMLIYKKYNVSPIGGCLQSFLQLPIFLAFLEAITRVPAIFESTLWKFQLGTTPFTGISSGNYWYLLLVFLIIFTTYLSFKFNALSIGSPEQEKQMKFMTNFMLIFISIASFSLPSAIALYWVVTSGFGVVQNIIMKKNLKE
ncbi:MAG: YidC/Oxa1 family membrane protein insertase [Bacilli bacterium]|nr:YidC/Oxa1 family membrane protein insertase [Bacilli bacterium]